MPFRIVIDTNVYLSHLLQPRSIPRQAVIHSWRQAIPLVNQATLDELEAVLIREKFKRYFRAEDVALFLAELRAISEIIVVSSTIRACRHPRDDKFLELAVDGRADMILTRDLDLLALHPFRGITIRTPSQYLAGS